uniref:E2F-associated phosphoprotein n=1 Tax=Araucaria cunninghamii TaxID=56994 RepID=A0A0D6RAT3_ARACU
MRVKFIGNRHEKYVTQYRAMFVLNCKVVENQRLRLPADSKKKRNDKKKSRGQYNGNNNNLHGIMSEDVKDEVFKPVCCSVCETEVAVLDEDEIYHFFNVVPSYA